MMRSRAAAGLILLVVTSTTVLAGCGNKGDDTTCRDFLKMSHSKQLDVINKGGFNPKLTTAEKQLQQAVDVCRTQPPDLTVGEALGP